MKYELKEVVTPQDYDVWEANEREREMKAVPKSYRDLKEKYQDVIILLQVGDFYETYGEDAKTCADILGITLNKANIANVEKLYRYCGFPKYALSDYLRKLVKAGKRVGVCEPIKEEKPKKLVLTK